MITRNIFNEVSKTQIAQNNDQEQTRDRQQVSLSAQVSLSTQVSLSAQELNPNPHPIQPTKKQNKNEYFASQLEHRSLNRTSFEGEILLHTDPQLSAFLYYDDETALWVIEFQREQQLISSALYQSESTALLILRSYGYLRPQKQVC